jgi:hypothetical protein
VRRLKLKIGLVQMEVKEELEKNLEFIKKAVSSSGAELLIFPELALTGYQKSKKDFNFCRIEKAIEELSFLARDQGKSLLLGLPVLEKDKIYNSAFFVNRKQTGCRLVDYRAKILFLRTNFHFCLPEQLIEPLHSFVYFINSLVAGFCRNLQSGIFIFDTEQKKGNPSVNVIKIPNDVKNCCN